MIRLVVVADSGAAMAAITATLTRIVRIDIVAYASGAAPVSALVRATRPDIVLVDEMRRPGLAAQRIAEARAAYPDARVVGLATPRNDGWAVAALGAGAAAVVTADAHPAAVALTFYELVGQSYDSTPMLPMAAARSAA